MKATQHYNLSKYDYKTDSTIDFVTGVAGVGSSSNMDKIDTVLKELSDTKSDKGHLHTKSEVGLNLVENYAIATSEEAIDGLATDKYMTPALVAEALRYSGGVIRNANVTVELRRVVKSVLINVENQKEVEIPLEKFDPEIHYFELRVGGVPFFHERYTVVENMVVLNAEEIGFAQGKRLDFIFYYLEQVGDNRLPVHGKNIYDGSVSEKKLSKELLEVINRGITNEDLAPVYEEISKKAELEHTHEVYANKEHDHDSNYAALNHSHEQYALDTHTHEQYSLDTHTHNNYAEKLHEHDTYANKEHEHSTYAALNHADSHMPGGADALEISEEMLSQSVKDKLNFVGSGGIGPNDLATIREEIAAVDSRVDTKADSIHEHGEYATSSHTHTASQVGAVSSSGGTFTGTYKFESLGMTDYAIPFECSQYIDFHKAGSTKDYDSRVYVDSNSKFRVVSGGYDYDINGEITNLKSSVSSGKTSVANAITAKGVSASSSDAFDTLATKIGQIKTESETTFEKAHELVTMSPGTSGVYVTPNFKYSGECFVPNSSKDGIVIQREGKYRFVVTYMGGAPGIDLSVKVYKNGVLTSTQTLYQKEESGCISPRINCVVGDVLSIRYAPLANYSVDIYTNFCFLARTVD